MLADYHVHTQFSDDSVYPLEDVIRDAVSMGLDEICITDHVDYGIKADWDSGQEIRYRNGEPFANVDYPRYVAQIAELQEKYKDAINIKLGLEFGVQTHTIPQYEALFRRYPFDFIILSIHQVEDKEFWTQDFQQGRTQREYNERYYEEMLRLYKDLGGSIITIGSDSHAPEHLGTYIEEAKAQLREIGFHSFCTYDKMRPVFHPL